MIPTHIFHTSSGKDGRSELEELLILLGSSKRAIEKYGKVAVITDYHGKRLIEKLKLPYFRLFDKLETGDEKVTKTDAKIIAFKRLSKLLPEFLYLDHFYNFNDIVKDLPIITGYSELSSGEYLWEYYDKKGVKLYFDSPGISTKCVSNLNRFKCDQADIIDELFDSYFTTQYLNAHLFTNDQKRSEFGGFIAANYLYHIIDSKDLVQNLCEPVSRDPEQDRGKFNNILLNPDKVDVLVKSTLESYPIESAKLIAAYG